MCVLIKLRTLLELRVLFERVFFLRIRYLLERQIFGVNIRFLLGFSVTAWEGNRFIKKFTYLKKLGFMGFDKKVWNTLCKFELRLYQEKMVLRIAQIFWVYVWMIEYHVTKQKGLSIRKITKIMKIFTKLFRRPAGKNGSWIMNKA